VTQTRPARPVTNHHSPADLPRRLVVNLWRWCGGLFRRPVARAALPPWPATGVVAVIVLLAVIVASMFLLDTAATAWARGLPSWFRPVFEEITNFGLSSVFLYPLGFLLLVLAAISSPVWPRFAQGVLAALAARFGFLFLAIGAPGLFTTIVKRMIGRARPYVGGHDNPFLYKPFIWRPEYASMPSGHSTTAVAAAIAVGAVWPRARPLMWLYALTIMFSRIVLTAHHPSDVLAGALVGGLGALMFRRAFAARRLVFCPSTLRPYPWPSWRRLKAIAVRIIPGGEAAPASRRHDGRAGD
jgi:membrane-associated phospholipid phosphatase